MVNVLTLNGGSSSIRLAVFETVASPRKILSAKLDRIGMSGTRFTIERGGPSAAPPDPPAMVPDRDGAVAWLMRWIEKQSWFAEVAAVGHRVVHGMQHAQAERITPELIAELKRITPYDPEHLPREIELMERVARLKPELPQVACFDTAFHHDMPRVATLLTLPRRYFAKGMRRYGFHGLSYTFLMEELRRVADPAAQSGRVILAHLGSGASLAAILDGRSMDTSMGFTPTAGVMMSTRSGDLDPGVVSYLASTESMSVAAFQAMTTHESGLLGVSETSGDVRDLLAREAGDERAREALDLFCYQIKKTIGAYAAALGGVDTLVFAGGIGENSPTIRARICAGLEFLGIELHEARNEVGDAVISADGAKPAIRVIRTDEESVIAASTLEALRMKTQGH